MTAMRQARLGGMKANSELEQQVYHLQGELERLQQELKDEEAEAIDALELNSEVCVRDSRPSSRALLPPRRGRIADLKGAIQPRTASGSSCTATWASSPSRRTALSPRSSSVRPPFSISPKHSTTSSD